MHSRPFIKCSNLEDTPQRLKIILIRQDEHPFGLVQDGSKRRDTERFRFVVQLIDAADVQEERRGCVEVLQGHGRDEEDRGRDEGDLDKHGERVSITRTSVITLQKLLQHH